MTTRNSISVLGARRISGRRILRRFAHTAAEMEGLWRKIRVKANDRVEITFRHRVTARTRWLLAPMALATVVGRRGQRRTLGLRFLIDDPRLGAACKHIASKGRVIKSGELVFQFDGGGRTYDDLFGSLLDPGLHYPHAVVLRARLTLQRDGWEKEDREPPWLRAGAFARGLGQEEGKNFFLFDCHSHWHPFELPPFTTCHGWVCSNWSRPPAHCLCLGLGGKWYPECNGFKCCFCDS